MNEMLDVMRKDLEKDVANSPFKRVAQVTQVLSQQSLDNSSKMGCGLGDATDSTLQSNNFKVNALRMQNNPFMTQENFQTAVAKQHLLSQRAGQEDTVLTGGHQSVANNMKENKKRPA